MALDNTSTARCGLHGQIQHPGATLWARPIDGILVGRKSRHCLFLARSLSPCCTPDLLDNLDWREHRSSNEGYKKVLSNDRFSANDCAKRSVPTNYQTVDAGCKDSLVSFTLIFEYRFQETLGINREQSQTSKTGNLGAPQAGRRVPCEDKEGRSQISVLPRISPWLRIGNYLSKP